jgi:uncharacterized protein
VRRIYSLKKTSIELIESLLAFKFLEKNSFEFKDEVLKRGFRSNPTDEQVSLGKKFASKIASAYIPDVSIRWIDEQVGYGLFTEEVIEAGSYVGEYTGVVRENDIRRYLEPLNHYCYQYPVDDSLGRNYVIDATSGNLTRFINHSFDPNLKPSHVYIDGFYHLIFIAMKRVEKGVQLFYNYGKNYWLIRPKPKNLSLKI